MASLKYMFTTGQMSKNKTCNLCKQWINLFHSIHKNICLIKDKFRLIIFYHKGQNRDVFSDKYVQVKSYAWSTYYFSSNNPNIRVMRLNLVNNYNERIVFLLQALLDVQWCNNNYLENIYIIKVCALKLLLSTNAFSECHKIFFYPRSCNKPFIWLYLLKNLNECKLCTRYVAFCM